MTEHDLLLNNVIASGWNVTRYTPSDKPLESYLKAYRLTGRRVTRVTWIIKRRNTSLECTSPNYSIHFRHH